MAGATEAVRSARSLVVRSLRPAAVGLTVRRIPANRAVVLMYHRIADMSFDPWGLGVAPEMFAEQMEVLRRRFHPISLSDLADCVERGEVPNRAVAVTFDDGYKDNLEAGKPTLERYDVPGTVFVTSGYVGSGRDFWWDELERIAFDPNRSYSGRLEAGEASADWALPPEQLYSEVWEQLYRVSDRRRVELMAQIAEQGGVDRRGEPLTMTVAELHRLADGGLVDIGGHTVSHPNLPAVSRAEQLEEIRGSRLQLEELLGKPVTSFCFPHGKFTPESVSCVVEGGFAQSCISDRGTVKPGVSRFEMPRLRVLNWYGDAFAWELAKFFREYA